jgi:hypothetical protein
MYPLESCWVTAVLSWISFLDRGALFSYRSIKMTIGSAQQPRDYEGTPNIPIYVMLPV